MIYYDELPLSKDILAALNELKIDYVFQPIEVVSFVTFVPVFRYFGDFTIVNFSDEPAIAITAFPIDKNLYRQFGVFCD